MPGVPSSRACEACRKQKKKCDEVQPSCGRCTRLNVPCIGVGRRRFIFKGQGAGTDSSENGTALIRRSQGRDHSPDQKLLLFPTNTLATVAHSFVGLLKVSTDIRFNLLWSFGDHLRFIPQRLGKSAALDAAAVALISAHTIFCTTKKPTNESLSKYSKALLALRSDLNDPQKACTADTLASTLLLSMCQTFNGDWGPNAATHMTGMEQILKARGYSKPKDNFEAELNVALKFAAILGGLFMENNIMTAAEWEKILIVSEADNTIENQFLMCLARARDLLCRDDFSIEEDERLLFIKETTGHYQRVRETGEIWGKEVEQYSKNPADTPPVPSFVLDHTQDVAATVPFLSHRRRYSLNLMVSIFLNLTLCSLGSEDPGLDDERDYLVQQILGVSGDLAPYQPLGGTWAGIALIAAWMGANDETTRSRIATKLEEFRICTGMPCLPTDQDLGRCAVRFDGVAKRYKIKRIPYRLYVSRDDVE